MRKLFLFAFLILIFGITKSQQSNSIKLNNSLDSTITELLSAINKDSIESVMRSLESFGTRETFQPNHREIAIWIQEKYIEYGYLETEIDSFSITFNDSTTWHYNIIATLEGSINPDQFYIIGGHWDSYSYPNPTEVAPGADDNASGTTAAIEIARVMKALNYQPEATIKFVAFDMEEYMGYSSTNEFGSLYFARKAFEEGMDIKLMINNDMIANSGNDDWKIQVLRFDNAFWASDLATYFTNEYTLISPIDGDLNPMYSDSGPFYLYGFPAIYFVEYEFSPNYHSATDVVDSLNLEYCTDAVKISCALLAHYNEVPYQVEDFRINQVGDGNSLSLIWEPVYNNDLDGYNVFLYNDNDEIGSSFFTTDTTITIANLISGKKYKFGISAKDQDQNEGLTVFCEGIPYTYTFDQGIAILDESFGGILDATDEEIDSFYDALLSNYDYTKYDLLQVDLTEQDIFGKYSTLIWHINKSYANQVIKDYINTLEMYLNMGGNLLLTADKLTFALSDESQYNRMTYFEEGDFIYDYLRIDSSYIKTLALFSGAYSNYDGYLDLTIDSTKANPTDNYHLKHIAEAIFPEENGETIYFYGTKYSDTTIQGIMKHMPVGVVNDNEIYKTIALGFPLYYMDFAQSKSFIDYVLQEVFGETTNSVYDISKQSDHIHIWPNPATDVLNLNIANGNNTNYYISIFDVTGKKLKSIQNSTSDIFQINISDLNRGIYFVKFETSNGTFLKKFIK